MHLDVRIHMRQMLLQILLQRLPSRISSRDPERSRRRKAHFDIPIHLAHDREEPLAARLDLAVYGEPVGGGAGDEVGEELRDRFGEGGGGGERSVGGEEAEGGGLPCEAEGKARSAEEGAGRHLAA